MIIKKYVYVMLAALLLLGACINQNTEKPEDSGSKGNFVFQHRPTTDITFLSTQMNPVEEAGKMRNIILKGFPGKVDFRPNDNNRLFSQIESILQGNPSESILIGALHGDLVKLYEQNMLQPLNDIYNTVKEVKFSENLISLSRLDGKDIYYLPWMQASFVMAANKKALTYLPAGVDINELTYDQLLEWAKNIYEKTGKKAVGFPAGGKGLMHRFFQGYLYPSFTNSTLVKFRSHDAQIMWEYFRKLWLYVYPGSLVYTNMNEPLLIDDVWIVWDHTARLVKAFEERPEDFIAFPAPLGPKGRGFMAVITGLSIPANVTDNNNLAILIEYLTHPEVQKITLNETGFFPVVAIKGSESIPTYLKELSAAVDNQANSGESIPTLLPIGLGELGADYNNLFMFTFSEIILEEKEITAVLDKSAAGLQKIINLANAKCWLPDVSDVRPAILE